MIAFQDVAISFGTQRVLHGVTVKINAKERIGIVGPNGAGKSTFFNLLTGELSPDHGEILFEGEKPAIGYLHQQLSKWDEGDTLLSYSLRASADLKAMEDEIARLEGGIAALPAGSPERARALARRVGAETPIIDEIYAILYEERNVPDAIRNLMCRSAKPE